MNFRHPTAKESKKDPQLLGWQRCTNCMRDQYKCRWEVEADDEGHTSVILAMRKIRGCQCANMEADTRGHA